VNFKKIVNLTICSFGIQFGSALQMANMSSIYTFLGASATYLNFLWLAGPITGLLVQPLIGQLSDNSRSRFGRRRFYMLLMAILAFISLMWMPNVSGLWTAAALLWLLDTSNNGVALPFRALITETTKPTERTTAFAWQALFSGLGATVAALSPWLALHLFGVSMDATTASGKIPLAIKWAFYLGAWAFLLMTTWTVFSVKEKPETTPKPKLSVKGSLQALWCNIVNMPDCIRKFYSVQLFTWMGLIAFWMYFALGLSQNVYGLPDGARVLGHHHLMILLERGTVLGGIAFATYQFVSFIYSYFIPRLAKAVSLSKTHAISLLFGGLTMLLASISHTSTIMVVAMIGVGVAWGSIMSVPYTILSFELPEETMGTYFGIFNMTIVIPQVIGQGILAFLMYFVFKGHAMYAVAFAGICLSIAAILMWGKHFSQKIVD
jgi:maltose/moltooligosaccharide transporter